MYLPLICQTQIYVFSISSQTNSNYRERINKLAFRQFIRVKRKSSAIRDKNKTIFFYYKKIYSLKNTTPNIYIATAILFLSISTNKLPNYWGQTLVRSGQEAQQSQTQNQNVFRANVPTARSLRNHLYQWRKNECQRWRTKRSDQRNEQTQFRYHLGNGNCKAIN